MTKYLLIAALSVALAFAGASAFLLMRNGHLKADNERLAASVAALSMSLDLSKEARDVADARAKGQAVKAAEYDKMKEAIMRGDDDGAIPAWMAEYLEEIFQ